MTYDALWPALNVVGTSGAGPLTGVRSALGVTVSGGSAEMSVIELLTEELVSVTVATRVLPTLLAPPVNGVPLGPLIAMLALRSLRFTTTCWLVPLSKLYVSETSRLIVYVPLLVNVRFQVHPLA